MNSVKYDSIEEIRQQAPVTGREPQRQGSSKLGKDEFLKLLMAQLSHQDPTSPADSTQFVAQLAQFASLEMMNNANDTLEALLVSAAAQQQASVVSLVGKEVLYSTEDVSLRAGEPVQLQATIDRAAGNVVVVVEDEKGQVVRRLELGPRDAGTIDATWDGRSDRGAVLPDGAYKVRITATDVQGQPVSVRQTARAQVTGVSYETGVPELLLGDVRINLAHVVEIRERKETP